MGKFECMNKESDSCKAAKKSANKRAKQMEGLHDAAVSGAIKAFEKDIEKQKNRKGGLFNFGKK